MLQGSLHGRLRKTLTKQAYDWLSVHKKKAFYNITEGTSFDAGAYSLIQNVGLGKLRPNMVILGYKSDWATCDRKELLDYYAVIK